MSSKSSTTAPGIARQLTSLETKYGPDRGKKIVSFLLGLAGIPWSTAVKGNDAVAKYLANNPTKLSKLNACIKNKCYITQFQLSRKIYEHSTP